jgi:formylglycine-generating enzyme required for sulfatase activity
MNSGTQSVAKIAAEATYTITITHSGIIPYEKTGVTITDGQTMDFVVTLIGGTPHDIQGITFVPIPAGSFSMGSTTGNSREQPVHTVALSAFEMGAYEITQAQYKSVIGSNPSRFTGDDNLPVEMVSWEDAVAFCNALSTKAGLQPCYNDSSGSCDFSKNGFRLPTEGEWEYACRAGSTTEYNLGGAENDLALARAGWYNVNSSSKTHPVGQKTPNAWGLYDMHGNVWEWCNDWFGSYTSGSATNPTGALNGSDRVDRGGCWFSNANYCKSAFRSYITPASRWFDLGFRVVRRP